MLLKYRVIQLSLAKAEVSDFRVKCRDAIHCVRVAWGYMDLYNKYCKGLNLHRVKGEI